MSNQVVPFNQQQLPAIFAHEMMPLELTENVGAGFAVVSIKGKVFRIRHGGTDTPLVVTHEGQQYAAPYFDVILVKANGHLSKTFYAESFAEGSTEQPDCSAEDGIHPVAAPGKQVVCADCRVCPNNVVGSKIAPSGAKVKLCADTRKVVVVPAQNPENEKFGGPMLLRVPGASLTGLAEFSRALQANGVPYYAVVVRMAFDQDPAYPKLVYKAMRVLTDAEAQIIAALRKDPRTALVLDSGVASAAPALPAGITADAVPTALQEPIAAAPQPHYAPPAATAPIPTAAVQPQYVQPVPIQPTVLAQQPLPLPQVPPAAPMAPAAAPAPFPGAIPMGPPPAIATAPVAAPAAGGIAVDAQFLESIDNLLSK